MGFSLNRVELLGNLGQDSETRFTQSGSGVTSFSLATVHSYKDKTEQWINETTWHNIIAWNISDYMKDQLKKGKKFYVAGRLTKEEYTDKEGIKRYLTKIIAEQIIPCEGGSNGNSGGYSKNSSSEGSSGNYSNNSDDDLPF